MNKIAITCGDPAGVGPELITKLRGVMEDDFAHIIYIPRDVLKSAEDLTGAAVGAKEVDSPSEAKSPGVFLIDIGYQRGWEKPSLASGRVALSSLARALADCLTGEIDGILTMPISKYWSKKAGFNFPGQTEYLANATRTDEFIMMMYSRKIRVVPLSTHLPLRDAINLVSKKRIIKRVMVVWREYKRFFKAEPTIGVLGLNPHAGEMGEFGREEIDEIAPAVEDLSNQGIKVKGPLSPDSAFVDPGTCDVFLAMYHDQGLIPFKIYAFREGVNTTLGLPFPRTSPDHGTAYDIAWMGKADPASSVNALELLKYMVKNLKE